MFEGALMLHLHLSTGEIVISTPVGLFKIAILPPLPRPECRKKPTSFHGQILPLFFLGKTMVACFLENRSFNLFQIHSPNHCTCPSFISHAEQAIATHHSHGNKTLCKSSVMADGFNKERHSG